MLSGETDPTSVRDACARLGVSVGYLAYRFPDELGQLRARQRLRRDRIRAQSERYRKAKLRKIVRRLMRAGKALSAEQVAVVYHGDEQRRSSGSLNRLIREVLAECRERGGDAWMNFRAGRGGH